MEALINVLNDRENVYENPIFTLSGNVRGLGFTNYFQAKSDLLQNN